jgi:hypothetical protein
MALEAVEQGLGGVVGDERLRRGHVHHIAAGGGGVEEGPVGEGARGHLAEPMVKGGEPAGQGGQDRHLLGGVAGHELGVLLIGGLAGELGEERADVVGEEPVHGGLLVRVLRGVEGRLRLEDPAVGLVQDPEQLGGGTPHPDRARGCSWWARCHRARPCGPRRARPSQGAGCSAPCRLRPRRPPPHRAGTADRAGCRTSGSRTSPQPRDPAQPGGQQRPSRVPFHRLGTRSPAAPTGPWTSGNQPAASPRRDDLLASRLPAPRLGALMRTA